MSTLLTRGPARTWLVALRALALVLVVTVLYTAAVSVVGLALPFQAHGSPVSANGEVVGSALLGQDFGGKPEWFQSRPSAAGKGWDGGASSASNLGPNDPGLLKAVEQRRAAGASAPDAVTASGSGLDPHISEANALSQADRVARARGLDPAAVRTLVERSVQAPDLGFLGQPTVNVLRLNLALTRLG